VIGAYFDIFLSPSIDIILDDFRFGLAFRLWMYRFLLQ
jgi:hypothetical protein